MIWTFKFLQDYPSSITTYVVQKTVENALKIFKFYSEIEQKFWNDYFSITTKDY